MQNVEAVVERLRQLLNEGDEGLAYHLAKNLAMRIRAIGDRSLLPEVIRTFTRTVDDATLLAVLHVLTIKGRSGLADFRHAATELALNSKLFRESLEYERIEDLYTAASAAHLREVSPMFFHGRHDPRVTVEGSGPDNPYLELPLGQRKSAARHMDRDQLDRLMRDKNPTVIRILLDNPRLVERDVITIAALRPTTGQVLEVIATHRKWATRYSVRKALACNPACPHPIASRLMNTLRLQDLRFIASTGVLEDHVREEARRLLRERQIQRQKPIIRGKPAEELRNPVARTGPRGRPVEELEADLEPLRRKD